MGTRIGMISATRTCPSEIQSSVGGDGMAKCISPANCQSAAPRVTGHQFGREDNLEIFGEGRLGNGPFR